MRARLPVFVLLAILSGCGPYRTVHVNELVPLENDASEHPLLYVGSDGSYHYFDHRSGNGWDKYRVSERELRLGMRFGRNSGRSAPMLPGTLESATSK